MAPGTPLGMDRFVSEFNQREYFRAHETLEAAWKRAKGPDRLFLQGLIQIAVGLAHVQRGNVVGALAQLDKGAAKLASAPDVIFGIDLARLRRQATVARGLVQMLGPAELGEFPWAGAPVIFRTPTS